MILLFDSSDMTVHMTVIDKESRHEYTWEAGRTLAKDMLQYMSARLAEQGSLMTELSGIGVFRGPGSYTGLRIGLTVLNTLAESTNVPIVGAAGDTWQQECLSRLNAGENDHIILPEYGGEAHITPPRK